MVCENPEARKTLTAALLELAQSVEGKQTRDLAKKSCF